jgi:hypothetical protein
MATEVFVFQEELFAENGTVAAMKPSTAVDIARINYFGDNSTFGNQLTGALSSLQRGKIFWNSHNYEKTNKDENGLTPSKTNDWSIILLPSHSSFTGMAVSFFFCFLFFCFCLSFLLSSLSRI